MRGDASVRRLVNGVSFACYYFFHFDKHCLMSELQLEYNVRSAPNVSNCHVEKPNTMCSAHMA